MCWGTGWSGTGYSTVRCYPWHHEHYYNHQILPGSAGPYSDRPFNPHDMGQSHRDHNRGCRRQVASANGPYKDYILGFVTFTFYDQLGAAKLTVTSVTPNVTVSEPAKKTITAAAVGKNAEWDTALSTWTAWKPGTPTPINQRWHMALLVNGFFQRPWAGIFLH